MKLSRHTLVVLLACCTGASAMAQNAYVKTVLIANNPSYSPKIIDRNMIDAWGIALRPPGAGGHI